MPNWHRHWLSEAANQWHVSRYSKLKNRSRRCLKGLFGLIVAIHRALPGADLSLPLWDEMRIDAHDQLAASDRWHVLERVR